MTKNKLQYFLVSSIVLGIIAVMGSYYKSRPTPPKFEIESSTLSAFDANSNGTDRSTAKLDAVFKIRVKSGSDELYLGKESSEHPMFSFEVMDAQGNDASSEVPAEVPAFPVPAGEDFVQKGMSDGFFYLPPNKEGELTVYVRFLGRDVNGKPLSGNQYSIQGGKITYSVNHGRTWNALDYSDQTRWRTNYAVVP